MVAKPVLGAAWPGAADGPASPSSAPAHMLTNSILIQTNDGRRFDSSIMYNRIVNDPFQPNTGSRFKTMVAICIAAAMLLLMLISESMGFATLPMAVTSRKYLGRAPNVGISSVDEDEQPSDNAIDALALTDDELADDLIGMEDDDFVDAPPKEKRAKKPQKMKRPTETNTTAETVYTGAEAHHQKAHHQTDDGGESSDNSNDENLAAIGQSIIEEVEAFAENIYDMAKEDLAALQLQAKGGNSSIMNGATEGGDDGSVVSNGDETHQNGSNFPDDAWGSDLPDESNASDIEDRGERTV